MSKIINHVEDVYKPFVAIVGYKTDDSDTGYYLEKHVITNGKMEAGKPLTEEMLSELISAVAKDNVQIDKSLYGRMPENVLYCDTRMQRDTLIWYHGPERRCVFFTKELEIPNGQMMVPGLVYIVKNGTLSIYAFKGNKPNGELYRAPFMNTVEKVCLGSAKVEKPKERTYEKFIAYWEKMFWMSEFSHLSGANPINGNLATLTKRLIETGEPFPEDVLKPIGKRINDVLK